LYNSAVFSAVMIGGVAGATIDKNDAPLAPPEISTWPSSAVAAALDKRQGRAAARQPSSGCRFRSRQGRMLWCSRCTVPPFCSEVHRNPLWPPTVAGSQSDSPPATRVSGWAALPPGALRAGRLIEPTSRNELFAALKTWAPALDWVLVARLMTPPSLPPASPPAIRTPPACGPGVEVAVGVAPAGRSRSRRSSCSGGRGGSLRCWSKLRSRSAVGVAPLVEVAVAVAVPVAVAVARCSIRRGRRRRVGRSRRRRVGRGRSRRCSRGPCCGGRVSCGRRSGRGSRRGCSWGRSCAPPLAVAVGLGGGAECGPAQALQSGTLSCHHRQS